MIHFKHRMKLSAIFLVFILSSLFFFGSGCTTYKEAVAVPEKITPVPAVEDKEEKNKKRVRIREQELREQALREEEARKQKEAAERVRFESEDIYFDFDRYLLSDSGKQNLSRKAQWLKQFPAVKAVIEGHCDERGSAEYNMALGQKRADAARQYLISMGISADRLSTISYGEEKPVDPRSNEEAWAKNRRVHFVLKIEIKELPHKA